MGKYNNPLVPEKKDREATYNFKAGQLKELSRRSVLDGIAAGMYMCNAIYSVAMLLTLHDKFGFGKERLNRAFNDVQATFEQVRDNNITNGDVGRVLKDELGINLIVERPDGVKQSALDLFSDLETHAKIEMVFDR